MRFQTQSIQCAKVPQFVDSLHFILIFEILFCYFCAIVLVQLCVQCRGRDICFERTHTLHKMRTGNKCMRHRFISPILSDALLIYSHTNRGYG